MFILPKIQTVGAARTIVGDAPQYHLQCTGAAVSEAAPGDIIAKQPGAFAQPRVPGWIRKPPSCMPPKLPLSKQPPRGLPSRLHVAVPSAGRTPPRCLPTCWLLQGCCEIHSTISRESCRSSGVHGARQRPKEAPVPRTSTATTAYPAARNHDLASWMNDEVGG